MKTVTISKEGIQAAIDIAEPKLKKKLQELVKNQLQTTDIKERVKTFDDACNELGLDKNKALPYSSSTKDDYERGVNAFSKLTIISKALNEGWEPDWINNNQYKYYPWFNNYKPGSGFSYDDYGCDDTNAHVGSRLCFKTRELAEYAGKQFIKIYNEFLTLK